MLLKKHLWLLSVLKTVLLLHVFVETNAFLFIWGIESFKEQHLFKIETFCNIINVLLSLFINVMHPCWIKVLISLKKKNNIKRLTPNLWTVASKLCAEVCQLFYYKHFLLKICRTKVSRTTFSWMNSFVIIKRKLSETKSWKDRNVQQQ